MILGLGCTATEVPSPPSIASEPTPATPPAPLLACPLDPQPVFTFEGLGEPLFATPPTEPFTRTYRGRVTLPIDLPDPASLWVLDQQATILASGESEIERWVQYEVITSCTTCEHAHARVGGPDAPLILTAPTDHDNDPVAANFSLLSTAWMAIGLATGDGPAYSEPIAYQQRPDLNSFVQDLAGSLAIDVSLRGTTGVSVHGAAAVDSEARFTIDDLVADPAMPTPPAPLLPWLLPIAQHGALEQLVVWGPQGRSAGIDAVDGRYQIDLPLEGDYTLRRVDPEGQSRSAILPYPPARLGLLELRPLDAQTLELRSEPEHWVVLRSDDEPIVCRTNEDGLVELPRPAEPFEVAAIEPQRTEVVAYRRCDPALICD